MTNTTNTFEILDDLELPTAKRAGGTRSRGPFATAVGKLDVGQGFVFMDAREIKKLYPTIAPKRYFGRKFTIRILETEANEAGEFKYGLKRTA